MAGSIRATTSNTSGFIHYIAQTARLLISKRAFFCFEPFTNAKLKIARRFDGTGRC
jgi:hypothetical protein